MAKPFDPNQYSAVTTFDEIYRSYQDAFDRVPAQVRSVDWMIDHLPSNAKVLDVGSGTGKPACEMLADAGLDVTGIDITPKMVEIARQQVSKAHFIVGDSRQWAPPSGEASFDGIVSYFSFIAGRAYNWLKPNGLFVFGTVPVVGEIVAIKWLGKDVVVSSLSPEDTIAAIEDAGFKIEKHETEMYTPKAAEAGICKPEEVWEEQHLFVYGQKRG